MMRTTQIMAVGAALLGAVASGPAFALDEAERRNKQVVLDFFEAFNRHDLAAMAKVYAPNAKLVSPDFKAPRYGAEGLRETYAPMFKSLPNIRDDVTSLVVQGDRAAVEFVSTWSAGPNIPAGRLELATFFIFKDGKIISDVTYYDVK